jgi:hypothetical protein
MSRPAERVVAFYNKRGTAEQWVKEGKGAITGSSLKEKLIKIGAKAISHGRTVAFQMAEVAIPRQMCQEILRLIAELRPKSAPA